MKTYISAFIVLSVFFISSAVFSQTPQGIQYQAIARDGAGMVLASEEVTFNFSIIQGSADGTAVYNETHTAVTNNFGLVVLTIGKGDTGDDFSSIDWSDGPYFLSVKINGISMGTSQLLSVPYALYAKEAGNVFSGNYDDLAGKPDFTGWDTNESDDFEGDYNNLVNKPDLSEYITSESDPLFNASVARGITSSDTTKWNQAYNSIKNSALIYKAGMGINITGNVISISIPDPSQPVPIKFQGGIIYVHPLLNNSDIWGTSNLLVSAYSETEGKANAETIVKALGNGTYPVKICYDLVDFGYDDWYLPSRYEIDAIYKQSYLLKNINYSSHYWSSTEWNKDQAWKVNFYNGAQTYDFKNRVNSFICIRRDK